MSKLLLSLVIAVTATAFSASEALAQRDAGAKARGEFGRGFWSPSYRQPATPSYNYSYPTVQPYSVQATQPTTEQYRSFSYEPIAITAGDMVTVTGENVSMMKGRNVVGPMPKETKFQVTKVTNGWLGTEVVVNGRKMNGWIWHENVKVQN